MKRRLSYCDVFHTGNGKGRVLFRKNFPMSAPQRRQVNMARLGRATKSLFKANQQRRRQGRKKAAARAPNNVMGDLLGNHKQAAATELSHLKFWPADTPLKYNLSCICSCPAILATLTALLTPTLESEKAF